MLSYSFSKRMSEKTVTVTKMGQDSLPPIPSEKSEPKPKSAGTLRKPLKSILKVKGVADPAKSPPLKKTARRSRIQILTDSGTKRRSKTIRRKLKKMSDSQASHWTARYKAGDAAAAAATDRASAYRKRGRRTMRKAASVFQNPTEFEGRQ